MYLAVGSRGRGMRRQGTRCEGYREAMLSAPWTARSPAPGDGQRSAQSCALLSAVKPVY